MTNYIYILSMYQVVLFTKFFKTMASWVKLQLEVILSKFYQGLRTCMLNIPFIGEFSCSYHGQNLSQTKTKVIVALVIMYFSVEQPLHEN